VPVSARDNAQTVSVVYGHRRGVGTTLHLGATFVRNRDPDAGIKGYQVEVFAKGSWAFEML
jgi:hypothetical protein